jgi:transposase
MLVHTLLADPEAIRLDCIRPSLSTIKLAVTTTASQAECPRCHRRSSRIHSRYIRHIVDLPWHGVAVKLELHTRRFRCLNSLCPQRIFCERLPRIVVHYACKTVRLSAALELIGFALGGEAGARLARELRLIVSPDTLPGSHLWRAHGRIGSRTLSPGEECAGSLREAHDEAEPAAAHADVGCTTLLSADRRE